MKKLFGWMQSKRQARAEVPAEEKKEAPAKVETSPLPEPVEDQKADAVEVVSTVEAVVAGWGAEPGEVAEVGAKARTQFHEPPVGRRGFPDFAAFCAGYGAGCGQCRFFHHGKGPFCMVWAEAWPDFHRETEPAKDELPTLPDESGLSLDDFTLEEVVEAVHEFFPAGPPMLYPTMPDWRKFCDDFPRCVKGKESCPFYRPGEACHCELFDKAFPGVGWWTLGEEKTPEAESSIMPEKNDAQAGRERLEADVAEVRARHKRAPLEYPDGPDWFAFCHAYPEGCDDCPYYRPKLACWCRLWEACFPGVVRWWSWDEAMQQVEATEG